MMEPDKLETSISGYIVDAVEDVNREFTDIKILQTSDVNIVAKGKRYGRWWILKCLTGAVADQSAYRMRLRKEMELLMESQHPNIVNVHGFEKVETLGECIVMEYIDGMTLTEWLKGRTKKTERIRVANEIMDAIAYIHAKGIVHRDLKPGNILISRLGEHVKVIDFGLADSKDYAVLKQPAGTVKYMSPEQMNTNVPDVRNDIYSLGIILQQMDLGTNFAPTINKCLSPINERYTNISELLEELQKRTKRRKRILIGCFIGLALIIALLAMTQMTGIQTGLKVTNHQLMEIQEQQEQQNEKNKRIDEAISKGKLLIDEKIEQTGLGQHLDTLSNVIYMRGELFDRLHESTHAITKYMETLPADFEKNEKEEIYKALMSYNGQRQQVLIDKFNKLMEEYAQQVM